ncbi:Biopolymer transport protein ExbB [Wohlfahrtiimonas chitiniclastica SH04]|uniref:Biopolymer transport protein ExbB n=1 Tax=Wohlfahrtiimonas chitiniclastica SH04 TaxID=1261130 RepID=L8Y0Q2_9GAMM|nr:Biopolymer transport protein ExbB [Wohlfahrtiimonas chitiniclastica SH04]MBS7819700.1 MotA/TolQ/ExbB proton channel family protein [Wohlfahrtiimonas chitiniclastica]
MEVGQLGFAHFIGQADVLSKSLLGILVVMSLISWSIIVIKAFNGMIRHHKVSAFFKQFNTAKDIHDLSRTAKHLAGLDYAQLTQKGIEAVDFYHDNEGAVLAESTTLTDFITITLRAELDDIQMHKENGLSVLATIAATAPFVGLFGTVWGIYHALITIGATGAGTIDKVAGPVGEALIMTGIGLAVAIPAVMAYNWLTRRNRVALGRLDTFAFKLIKLLSGHAKEV